MIIWRHMGLEELAERMDANGDGNVSPADASRMRDLLVEHAESFEWERTSDVEDVDWFRMMDQAVAS